MTHPLLRRLSAYAMALFIALFATFALGEGESPAAHGLTEMEWAAYIAILSDMEAYGVPRAEGEALVEALLTARRQEDAPGTLAEGMYTSPLGFAFPIPAGYELLSGHMGLTAVLMGPKGETGLSPTITLALLEEGIPAFDTGTREDYVAFLGDMLPGYMLIAMDDFPFLDGTGHEMILLSGEGEDGMLMQHLFTANHDGKALIITMTALAEEATYTNALEALDTLLSGFTIR